MILSSTETFRREKSARNTIVSSTREFWNIRSKTKSWNFEEVRWRPYSPKESFERYFISKKNLRVCEGSFHVIQVYTWNLFNFFLFQEEEASANG